MLKILFNIGYFAFLAFLGAMGLILVSTLLPLPGNYEAKVVQSGSMEPAIMTGSLIVTKPATTYEVGDVITFGEDTKTQIPTTHRITKLNEDGTYTVKGDANDTEDINPVRKDEVIGKVIFAVPNVGYVIDFARQPLGFALLIGFPAAVVVIDEVSTIVSEVRNLRRKKKEELVENQTPDAS